MLNFLLHCYVYVHSAWKGRPRNDLYCVGWDVKPYSLTHSRTCTVHANAIEPLFQFISAALYTSLR